MSEKRKNESIEKDTNKLHKSETLHDNEKSTISMQNVALLIKNNEIELFTRVIKEGRITDINQTFGQHPTNLLHVACDYRSLHCVKLLVEKNADINNEQTKSDLLTSIIRGYSIDILKYLLENGLIISDEALLACKEFFRLYKSNNEIFTILFNQIKDVNLVCIRAFSSFLCRASEFGNLALVKLLLERGAERDKVTFHNYDALQEAAANGHTNVVTFLLNWNRTETPVSANHVAKALCFASMSNHLNVVRLLVEYWEGSVDRDALTCALFEAVPNSDPELITYLIDQGADVNGSCEGMTPLNCACAYERPEIMKLLIARGADPDLAEPKGDKPIESALFKYDVIKVLLEHGVDPNQLYHGHSTVLLEALRSGDV